MFTLDAGKTLAASGPTAVNFFLFGDEVTTTDAFKIANKGSLSLAATVIYTATGVQALLKTLEFFNTAGTPSTIFLYANGTATTDRFFAATIPAGGTLTYGAAGWQLTDATGTTLVAATPITASGDATGTQVGSNIALTLSTFGPGAVGPIGSATQVAAVSTDAKGRVSALSAVSIQIAESQVTNLVSDLAGKAPSGNYITGLNGDVSAVGPGSATATLATFGPGAIGPIGSATQVAAVSTDAKGRVSVLSAVAIQTATVSQPGFMTALDKLKLDNIWIDVTANTIALVTPAQSAATNTTNMATLLSGAPNGSTIFFPAGTYQFSGVWTYPAATAKMFIFKGVGSNRAGSPATTYTELRWTSNVGGDIITLPGSSNGWYTEFINLCFTSAATQSAGALVNVNGNVGTNFRDCAFQSVATGNTWNIVLDGSGQTSNSWNSAVIDNCSFQGFTNTAIRCNSSGSSLVITNTVIQGQWGLAAQVALSCLNAKWVGAMQIIGCDFIGANNNLLIDPTFSATSTLNEVAASIHCTNTYFDNSLGSTIKFAGTGFVVRCKFDTCTGTTAPGSGFSVVEMAGTCAYTAATQDISFVNCNFYNTFGTTGATTGVLITNAADVSFTNVKVAGWNVGYSITPKASNITNVQIIGGTVGASGGYGLNTTGFLIAAGAYKGLQIRGVNAIGNTANLNLGAVTVLAGEGSLFAITENAGINPRGALTGVLAPAVPATGVAATNTTGFRVLIAYKSTATAHTSMTINGVVTGVPLINQLSHITLEPGGTIIWTGGTAPTWVWVGQ